MTPRCPCKRPSCPGSPPSRPSAAPAATAGGSFRRLPNPVTPLAAIWREEPAVEDARSVTQPWCAEVRARGGTIFTAASGFIQGRSRSPLLFRGDGARTRLTVRWHDPVNTWVFPYLARFEDHHLLLLAASRWAGERVWAMEFVNPLESAVLPAWTPVNISAGAPRVQVTGWVGAES